MRLRTRLALGVGGVGLVVVASVSAAAWALSADEVRDGVDAELRQRLAPLLVIDERIASGEISLTDVGGDLPAGSARLPTVGEGRGEVNELGRTVIGLDGVDASAEALIDEGEPARIQFVLADGSVAATPVVDPTPAALASLDDGDIHFETIEVDDIMYRVATAPMQIGQVALDAGLVEVDDQPVGVQVLRDIGNEESALSDLALRLAALSLLGVSVVALASWLIGRWMARPALELTERAEHLASLDDLPSRVEIARSDEFGRLAGSFNRMLSALEIGREQQRRLVADASHELRTPLTSLRMRLEYLRKHAPDDRRADVLDGAVSDAEQLSALVHDLVDLAADVRNAEEDVETVLVGDLVRDVADQARAATRRDIAVVVDDTVADVRPTMLRRAIRNLVDNAVKYAPDGPIEIRAEAGRIAVHDAGPGIAADERDVVFDRFYRSPKARERTGNGIGLAIVQQVAEAHGGTTWVASSPLGGAEVGLTVEPLQPLFRSDSAASHAPIAT